MSREELIIPSPFPGMDRYLEGRRIGPDILVLAGWEYPRAQLFAFNLPQPIPEVPVPPHEGEAPVPLPLGRLLNEVSDRARSIGRVWYEAGPSEPPLAPEAAAWVDTLPREQGRRAG